MRITSPTYTLGRRIVANLFRNTTHCVVCQSTRKSPRYAICEDCNAANLGKLSDVRMLRRFARNTQATYAPAPTGYNIEQKARALRAANRPEAAFNMLLARKRRSYNKQLRDALNSELLPRTAYGAKFDAACKARFEIDDKLESAVWRLLTEQQDEDRYPGFTLTERLAIDTDEARRAREYPREFDIAEACDEELDSLVEAAREQISRVPEPKGGRKLHETRVREFLAKRQLTPAQAQKPRRRRLFARGFLHASGTYVHFGLAEQTHKLATPENAARSPKGTRGAWERSIGQAV